MLSTKQSLVASGLPLNVTKQTIDDNKYIGGSFKEWCEADKDNPLSLYYKIMFKGKLKAEFFDNITINYSLMEAIQTAKLLSVSYETKYIVVTIEFDEDHFYNGNFLLLQKLKSGFDLSDKPVKSCRKK